MGLYHKSGRSMNQHHANSLRSGPDDRGRFGIFGGRFVSETLMPLILELEARYDRARTDPAFAAEMEDLLEALCRPALAALSRRAADRRIWAARRST
ncbi:MAG: hypothetical protein KatS3mg118_0406 [Paracoccaceae bacterium]|nr:MAG: hypothetical protein KatS3mg118_0406 [Paracoccaceae bacterium]